MKYSALSIGFLTVLLPVCSAHAEQGLGDLQLYEKMHDITLQEVLLKNVDEDVINYVAQLAAQEKLIPEGKSVSDMTEVAKAAFETRLDDFCEMYTATFDGCPQAYQMFRDLGMDIIETRTLSTDLLHIATGYETGVSGNMGEIFTIAERTLTIRNLWRSQDDALLTSEVFPQVRAVPRPDSVTEGLFDDLGSLLGTETPDLLIHRYHYGIAAFDDKPCSNFEGSSELHEITEWRDCEVEKKLRALRDALPSAALDFDPPLQRGEIVIFPLRRFESPPNTIVWMMAENVNGTIKRDVGLGWQLMLNSVPIGILGGEICDSGKLGESYCTVVDRYQIRPGGRYENPPIEPVNEGGLCHLAFARDGYLCRPLRQDRCDEKIPGKEPRSIVLTECKPSKAKEPVAITESGPDICRTGWWRIPGKELTQSSSSSKSTSACSLCSVDIQCSESCEGGAVGFTGKKNADGKISICISSNAPQSGLLSMIVHELTHAQQLCNLAAGTDIFDTAEECCAHEFEAYRTSCRILAEQGVLDELGISLEECTGRSANASCSRYGEKACSDFAVADMKERVEEILKRKDSKTSPLSCGDLTSGGLSGMARLDSRILSMIEGLDGACSPGCQTTYENSIGNNLCYIGQCVEQSIEQERVIPGRMALSTEDEAFPWDACAANDTQAGGMIALPAISPPLMPAYNPRLLAESLDRALCQLNGLPAFSLPIRCQFDYQRRLSNTTSDYVSTIISLTSQIEENEEPAASLQRMTQGIATRIGTSLLTRYLSWAGDALSDTLRAGNQLLNSMEKTKFPLYTCPRNATEKPDFCGVSDSSPE